MKIAYIIIVLLTVSLGCSAQIDKPQKTSVPPASPAELIFQSGFEAGSKVVPDGTRHDMIGQDNSLSEKSDWVNDLENKGGTTFRFEYTGGDDSKRYTDIVSDPVNPKNKVLHFWLNDYWLASENQEKARVQADLYGIKGGYKEFYQSVRVYLADDFNTLKKYPKGISWLTISEFWNNEWWASTEKYGFRITLGIGKPAGESDLYFILNAENAGQKEVWKAKNDSVKVPVGKWFTMDYYFKEGDNQTGRFYMAITPDGGNRQVVYDVRNFTHNTFDPAPNGLTGYNPMKLYTSKELVSFMKSQSKTLQIYWDDFKLWKNKQP
ncbi:hypothetical protein [Dyadobacter sp. CY356]|uniref:hypothetical protein n=1 Tax=Dyadobacter sp. CY356 TaxID=2906442 RepID=UPI001F36C2C7|nr:hypothetical protein [Dyadobacter sp. CY356]MCF0054793.1 hypothetical protein [Dyadobacter sp. CY356]